MNNKSYNGSWCIRKIFPMNLSFKNINFKLGIVPQEQEPLKHQD